MAGVSPGGPAAPVASTPRWRRFVGRAIVLAGWLTLILLLAVWGCLRLGDTWAPATFLMFGPLWAAAIPPAMLLPFALLFRRRALLSLVPAILVAAGPVMGFCIPWGELAEQPTSGGPRLRAMTCNMHDAKTDSATITRAIDASGADVVAIQELRGSNYIPTLQTTTWYTHNTSSLYLASRYPIRRPEHLGEQSDGPRGSIMRYELETPDGIVTLYSLHLATPRHALLKFASRDSAGWADVEANSELRRSQSRLLIEDAARVRGPVLLVGDFNTPSHSTIFHDLWGGYDDAFSSAGWGWGYTFFARRTMVRIDHILLGGGGRATRSWVGPDVGSPHRPVLADVVWPAPRIAGNPTTAVAASR